MNNEVYEVESSLMPEGDYECKVEKMEVKTTPNGYEYLNVTLRVRTDVEQNFRNKVIFDMIFKQKDNPNIFNKKKISALLSSQGVKAGERVEGINKVIEKVVGGNVVAHIGCSFDEYWKEDRNYVAYYKTSSVQPKQVGGGVAPDLQRSGIVGGDSNPFF